MSRTKRNKIPHEWVQEGKEWRSTSDRKKWSKPNSGYKKTRKSVRKAKEKQSLTKAIVDQKDFDELIIPEFPKSDEWDWN